MIRTIRKKIYYGIKVLFLNKKVLNEWKSITGLKSFGIKRSLMQVYCNQKDAMNFYKYKGRFPNHDECQILENSGFSMYLKLEKAATDLCNMVRKIRNSIQDISITFIVENDNIQPSQDKKCTFDLLPPRFLVHELQLAIDQENYERAAEIRDCAKRRYINLNLSSDDNK
jgi:hypothetical protein